MAQRSTEYVLTAEAAKVLGVSQNTLRAWAEAGKIPMHRNPASAYRWFRRSDLHEFHKQVPKPVKPKLRSLEDRREELGRNDDSRTRT